MEKEFTLTLPRESIILTCKSQNNRACMWAIVNEDNESITRYFMIVGTGHNFDYHPLNWIYIGTDQIYDALVWHLFEIIK